MFGGRDPQHINFRPLPADPPQPKKLMREELRDRSAKGLCWHCDEPWRCDHHCKKGQLLLIEPADESEQEEEDPEHEENTKEDLQSGDSMVLILREKRGSDVTTIST
ncbi:hypothetical protein BHM03_00014897 [Ensete ventricosum]|nr:hypothetical protein BHM03_00014897 [Ensete ventricosum]